MPPSLLPPTPEELEELRQRRRASQLKGYGAGAEDPIAQALLNMRRNLGEAGRAVVGAKPYDETNPTGSYRAVQALMNAPTPAAIIPEAAQAAGKAATALSGLGALGVVKPKGGNWLAGTVERGLKPFKALVDPELEGYARRGQILMPHEAADVLPKIAINDWIDTKLGKYIRNEMATPEDPVRALAERGVLHVDPETLNQYKPTHTAFEREMAGFPPEGLAQSPGAQRWEDITDYLTESDTAGNLLDPSQYGKGFVEKILETNPWLAKVDPETPVYGVDSLAYRVDYEEAGFRHLIDELMNATDPDSGLPRSLQLSPDKLQKVTVPQAVELVDKINKWRAEQKVAADLKRSKNAATVEYKAYDTIPGTTEPNQRGLRWVELALPPAQEDVSSMIIQNAGKYSILEPGQRLSWKDPASGRVLFDTPEKASAAYNRSRGVSALEESLKYEGETMGHCVGGYCPDVEEGRSRIYSLRDAKGEPHVTVEVQPEKNPYLNSSGGITETGLNLIHQKFPDSNLNAEYNDWFRRSGQHSMHFAKGYAPWIKENHPEIYEATIGAPAGQIIKQIKGKANKAPKDEYLPFVQDFVRSGRWSSVGDLGNTGLIRKSDYIDTFTPEMLDSVGVGEYMTKQEFNQLADKLGGINKMAAGGAVSMQDGGAVHLKKGGAVTDPNEPEVKRLPEPGLLTATMYAETAAREMYPKDPVKRDAARHMIASSILGQKLSPGTSRLLGELYEFKTSPLLHLKSAVGLGAPPPGYEMDKFNNALGSEMQFRNQAELQRGVRQAVDTGRARLTPDEPAPYRRGGAVKIETNPTLMADELLFKGYRR
jgi:hypothetical protein